MMVGIRSKRLELTEVNIRVTRRLELKVAQYL